MSSPTLPIVAAIAALALTAATPVLAGTAATATGGAGLPDPDALTVVPGALLGADIEISGSVPDAAGDLVRIERRAGDDTWIAVARARADAAGAFSATWDADAAGVHALRAVPDRVGPTDAAAAEADHDVPLGATTVFRRTLATWYGPGLWGRHTACGVRLRRATLGVAHRTLPCGTRVALFLGGRQIEVPVIDRGPFNIKASLDLTRATAQAIGMTQTQRIGWLRTTRVARPAPTAAARPTTPR